MVVQIDGKGYIKGTNTLYREKVKVVNTISVKGIKHTPGAVIELQGDDLVTAKRLGKVVIYVESPLDSLPQTPTLETAISPEENFLRKEIKTKKLGLKKKKTLRQAQGDGSKE